MLKATALTTLLLLTTVHSMSSTKIVNNHHDKEATYMAVSNLGIKAFFDALKVFSCFVTKVNQPRSEKKQFETRILEEVYLFAKMMLDCIDQVDYLSLNTN